MSPTNFPQRAVVVRAHRPARESVLAASAGDILHPLRREAEWPGWVWCADGQGVEAWVPERWLRYTGRRAVLIRDYNSSELSLQPGMRLTVLDEESGWVLASLHGGDIGWAPVDCLQIIASE